LPGSLQGKISSDGCLKKEQMVVSAIVSTPQKAKGVGELGLCGVSAAIANAVYNATGIRVRDYPITLDKLLDKLPDVV
ncbi:hypothetical protein, partial [Escherichia coli]|uniref:hypothetical protein n=3 Tax=Escherichia coli TaxID=562 RepID=UPI0012930C36